ncbi:hypothetical protein EV1_004789 [Malus domestica]
MQAQQNPNIPVSEIYCSLLHKADKKFSKIRELPYYHRNKHEYDAYFYKVFKVYTQLWKFQQENRQKLVESCLRRSEIGEIASRIAQLYLGQYMRTSEASYLSEAYIFYEAILSREYFKEGMFQDLSLVNKQLRFVSRFLMVCLLLNRREMVQQLLNQLRVLVDETVILFLSSVKRKPIHYFPHSSSAGFLFTAWYFTLFDIDNGLWSIFRSDSRAFDLQLTTRHGTAQCHHRFHSRSSASPNSCPPSSSPP